MFFDFHVSCGFGFERLRMSKRSETLANYVRQFKERQPAQDAATVIRNRLLDEGYARLQADVKAECEKQADELNGEAGCAGALVCRFSGNDSGVFRTDDAACLSVKWDAPKRSVTLICEKPTKFKYIVEVKLTNNETNWYFAAGPDRKSLTAINNQIDWIIDKGLFALFDVEA